MAEQEKEQKGPEIKDIPGLSANEEAVARGTSSPDDAALKEASQLSSGRSADDLKRQAAENEHIRNETFKDLFDGLVQLGMLVAFVAVMVMGAVWVWHLISPAKWQWMTDGQIDHIQNLVTGGVIAVVVGDHFKRRLG